MKVMITRRATAPKAPQKMPFLRCSSGRERTAMPMTTALSPARVRSMIVIERNRTMNSHESSMNAHLPGRPSPMAPTL
jgi:hypothetical protein